MTDAVAIATEQDSRYAMAVNGQGRNNGSRTRRLLGYEDRTARRMWQGVLRLRAAWVYLTGSPKAAARLDSQRLARPCGPVMLIALVCGVFSAELWELVRMATWRPPLFDERLMPSIAAAGFIMLVFLRRSALSLSELFTGRRRYLRYPAALALAGVYWLLLWSLWQLKADYATNLPPQWGWLWPRAIFRVMVLTQLWGAWGMLVLGQFHRPSATTDAPTVGFASQAHPLTMAACLLVPLLGTVLCTRFLGTQQFVPIATALAGTFILGSLLAIFRGPMRREILLATNLLTQMAFMSGYLLVR